ncbi:MAG: glutaredoxin family protein [bacterium]|nr:glutaredoxin family protein [bacterium]
MNKQNPVDPTEPGFSLTPSVECITFVLYGASIFGIWQRDPVLDELLPRVKIYSKDDCHLCAVAKERVENVRKRILFELEVVDITTDSELFERYKERIPVVLVNDAEVCVFRVSEKLLARKVREALGQGSLWTRLKDRLGYESDRG